MGFRKDSYAKVWSVESVSDTNTKLRISISRKNKQTGEYEDDFSGFVNCIGTAVAKKAANLKEGARIKLGDVDTSSNYVKEKNTTYYNFKIFSFESVDGNTTAESGTNEKPDATQPTVDSGEIDDSRLPF